MTGIDPLFDELPDAERWDEPPFLRYTDATLWVAARDPRASAKLEAYREGLAQAEADEWAGWASIVLVADALGGADRVDEGVRQLTAALQSNRVWAFGARSADGEMERIKGVEWTRPFSVHPNRRTDSLVGEERPWPTHFYHLVLDGPALFSLWPRRAVDPEVSKIHHPSSMELADAPLLAEMRQLIESGKATSPYSAALEVADQAQGASLDAKVSRLRKRYTRAFGS